MLLTNYLLSCNHILVPKHPKTENGKRNPRQIYARGSLLTDDISTHIINDSFICIISTPSLSSSSSTILCISHYNNCRFLSIHTDHHHHSYYHHYHSSSSSWYRRLVIVIVVDYHQYHHHRSSSSSSSSSLVCHLLIVISHELQINPSKLHRSSKMLPCHSNHTFDI
jgi:hypothetical protein